MELLVFKDLYASFSRLCLTVLVGLAGCGGGGSDAPSNPGLQRDPLNAARPCDVADLAAVSLAAVNRARASAQLCISGPRAAVPALQWDSRLAAAAAGHGADMAANGFFSHTGSQGSILQSRVNAAGYTWSSVAENLARNTPAQSVDDAVQAWLSSDRGHCENLMATSVTQMGMACYRPMNASSPTYWVLVMAAPR